jgi:hypothetical protein
MAYTLPRPEAAVRERLRELAAGDRRWQTVRDRGDWGDTNHTGRIARKAKKLLYCVETRPGRCYANAFEAALNSPTDVTYVEGLATPGGDDDPTPIPHAWVQVDGTVLELTWADRASVPLPPEGSAYYGVAIDRETLRTADSERDRGEPFLPATLPE